MLIIKLHVYIQNYAYAHLNFYIERLRLEIQGVYLSNTDVNVIGGHHILTCISTGGPVTTVTWTRNSQPVTGITESVLDDPEIAQYHHTLTITIGGRYTCRVGNAEQSYRYEINLKGNDTI